LFPGGGKEAFIIPWAGGLLAMADTPVGTIETLLESVLEETSDENVHFKLRTALQLLSVIQKREQMTEELLEETEMDGEVRQRLQDLGYLNE
jgi:hypothetical protein